MGIEIEWFRQIEAQKAADIGVNTGDFSENARDYMIGAHAYIAPWILITYNKRDFSFLGDRVKEPYEFMNSL